MKKVNPKIKDDRRWGDKEWTWSDQIAGGNNNHGLQMQTS
jgi:hypothetical protein